MMLIPILQVALQVVIKTVMLNIEEIIFFPHSKIQTLNERLQRMELVNDFAVRSRV